MLRVISFPACSVHNRFITEKVTKNKGKYITSMEFWKEGLFLFTNNGVIWSKSGYYAHNHIILLTNSNYIINYTGHIKLKEKYIFSFYSMCHNI